MKISGIHWHRAALVSGFLLVIFPVKPEEVFRVYQLAGELKATIFTHVREGGIMAVQQAIADAVLTGAPLHIVHINSATLGQIDFAIEMVQAAKNKGFDITTELYPYTAASTLLQSALFNEGWQERLGISYGDLQWVATGERLTKETFESYRKTGGIVIIHSMKPEWIQAGIASPRHHHRFRCYALCKTGAPQNCRNIFKSVGKICKRRKSD